MSLSPAATAARQRQSAWTTYEADLGTTSRREGTFTITDSGIAADSKVLVQQAPGPYTGKGSLADEAQMDSILAVASPGAGFATVYWRTADRAVVKGKIKFFYTVV
jgi:hypothetical protein